MADSLPRSSNRWTIPHPRSRSRPRRRPRAQPKRRFGHDVQWQLDCEGNVALNVLVNGSAEQPSVWVFAAHDALTGVFGKAIMTKDDVPEIIRHIQKRLDLPLPVETP